jgi:hypothetical protein
MLSPPQVMPLRSSQIRAATSWQSCTFDVRLGGQRGAFAVLAEALLPRLKKTEKTHGISAKRRGLAAWLILLFTSAFRVLGGDY